MTRPRSYIVCPRCARDLGLDLDAMVVGCPVHGPWFSYDHLLAWVFRYSEPGGVAVPLW